MAYWMFIMTILCQGAEGWSSDHFAIFSESQSRSWRCCGSKHRSLKIHGHQASKSEQLPGIANCRWKDMGILIVLFIYSQTFTQRNLHGHEWYKLLRHLFASKQLKNLLPRRNEHCDYVSVTWIDVTRNVMLKATEHCFCKPDCEWHPLLTFQMIR